MNLNSKIFFKGIFSFYLLLLMSMFNAEAFESCPRSNDELFEMKGQLSRLRLIDHGLSDFLNGRVVNEKSLSALFIVNTEDNEQIQARKKELELFLSQDINPLKCRTPEMTSAISQVQNLKLNIAKARLNFLSLPEKQRQALVALQKEAARNQYEIEKIKKVERKADERINQIEVSIRKAEAIALSSQTSELRELAAEIAIIQRFRKTIAEQVARLSSNMKAIGAEYQVQTERLGEMSAVLGRPSSSLAEIDKAYDAISTKWRKIVDDVVSMDNSIDYSDTVKLPKNNEKVLSKAKAAGLENESKEYNDALTKAKVELDSLKELKLQLLALKREQRYHELVIAGQIRSQIIRMAENKGGVKPFQLSDVYLSDVAREIKLVPYRPKVLFLSAVNKIKETMAQGLEGVVSLLKNLFVLSLFVIIPIFSVVIMRRFLAYLEERKRKMIRMRNKGGASKLLNWLLWLRPYIPWIVMLVSLNISKSVVKDTEVDWLSEVLPYFNYYFVYRLFKEIINSNLLTINRMTERKLTYEIQSRITKTSNVLGIFFLISAYLLETTATVARRALFYRLIWDVLTFLVPIVLAFSAYFWRKEILSALKQVLPLNTYHWIEKYMSGFGAFFFSLPAAIFLIIVIVFQRLKTELFEVDTIKSLSAQLFRRKIESNIEGEIKDNEEEISQSYKDNFLLEPLVDKEIYVSTSSPLDEIENTIERWYNEETDERSLVVFGEKGLGKSSSLNLLNISCEVTKTKVNKKIISELELISFLKEKCKIELRSDDGDYAKSLFDYDEKLEVKRVIVIDDAQNLFLSHRKGFQAYRLFSSLITLNTKNIFWCISLNYYSWTFLNSINNGSQFFRKVIKLSPWDDESIKELILSRHKKSGFELEFNPAVYSLTTNHNHETFQYIQDRFFELLWEQAKGNPRTALSLWVSSLTYSGENKIKVGLPGGNLNQKSLGLNEDELFVIASIVRHENLDSKSAVMTTGLDKNVVQYAVRTGVEKGFLLRDEDGFYRLSSTWQPIVMRQLIAKNLIYG